MPKLIGLVKTAYKCLLNPVRLRNYIFLTPSALRNKYDHDSECRGYGEGFFYVYSTPVDKSPHIFLVGFANRLR